MLYGIFLAVAIVIGGCLQPRAVGRASRGGSCLIVAGVAATWFLVDESIRGSATWG